MLHRDVEAYLATLLNHFPCVVVTGVRQCGKTTLLSATLSGWQRFDMESTADRQQVLTDVDLFLRLYPERVFIDEAQLAPELFPALRVAIDRDRGRKGRFVLSGSSSPDLARHVSETLAGRVGLLEMGPLTLSEAWALPAAPFYRLVGQGAALGDILAQATPRLSARQVREYWFQGGYPEPWLNKDPEFRGLWFRNYLDTYLLRDIGALFPNLNRDRYRQFTQLLGNVSGSILNNADLARDLGVSEPTVRDWLQIAHGTYLWRHIPAWSRSAAKQLVKHPKGYLRDSGLLHRLLHVADAEQLALHPMQGRSWEGMVIETLLRGFENAGIRVEPFHYRTRGGAEVDLVLAGDFGLLPVEIKLASQTDKRALRSLNEFIDMHACPFGLVVNNDEKPRLLDERILALPVGGL